MGVLHMEPEQVRVMAQQLNTLAETLKTHVQNLSRASYNLDWSGGGRDAYLAEMNAVTRSLTTIGDAGSLLSLRVQREVDEWETVDSQGTASFFGITADACAGFFAGNLFDIFRMSRGNIKEYTLEELLGYIGVTPAGKDLIERAKEAGLGFKLLPDGAIIGDPEGEIIEISLGETEENVGGYQSGNKIILSSNQQEWYGKGSDNLGGIIAHEMQHALDMKLGLKDRNPYGDINLYMDDPKALETFLEKKVSARVGSEVRSFERGDAVADNRTYQDDGITTKTEVENIMYSKNYQDHYESELNENPSFSDRYTVDFWVDPDGNVQATVIPVPPLQDIITLPSDVA